MADFDAEIAARRNDVNAVVAEMDAKRTEYLAALKLFVRQFFDDTSRQAVATYADLAQQLGKERLGTIKKQVNDLIRVAPELTDEMVGDLKLWPHLQGRPPIDPKNPYWPKEDIPKPDQGLRRLLWKVYEILQQDGLVHKDFWQAGRQNGGYPYGIRLPAPIEATYGEYFELYRKLWTAFEKLDSAERAKKEAAALGLWDKS